MNEKLEIYTDGACKGNPGIGGWGCLIKYGNKRKEFYGFELNTTNNKMELTAVIKALSSIKQSTEIVVYSDSRYVIDGITKWVKGWKKNGWQTKSGDVKNIELWIELDRLNSLHKIRYEWVRGHSGNPDNEYVDKLANRAITEEKYKNYG